MKTKFICYSALCWDIQYYFLWFYYLYFFKKCCACHLYYLLLFRFGNKYKFYFFSNCFWTMFKQTIIFNILSISKFMWFVTNFSAVFRQFVTHLIFYPDLCEVRQNAWSCKLVIRTAFRLNGSFVLIRHAPSLLDAFLRLLDSVVSLKNLKLRCAFFLILFEMYFLFNS